MARDWSDAVRPRADGPSSASRGVVAVRDDVARDQPAKRLQHLRRKRVVAIGIQRDSQEAVDAAELARCQTIHGRTIYVSRRMAVTAERATTVAHRQPRPGGMTSHRRRSTMPTFKRLLAVTGAIAALMAFVPVALAGTHHPFHVAKTCADDASEPLGFVCTVQHSDFKWIPAGTDVRYLSQDGAVMQLSIGIANGSTHGACTWSSDVDAICVFSAGTGRLTQFHLDVVVTANADQSVWYWDGAYWFGG